MVLQQLRVGDLSDEELPQLGQMLSMVLQHTALHNQLLANAALLQEIIQNLTVNTANTYLIGIHFKALVKFRCRSTVKLPPNFFLCVSEVFPGCVQGTVADRFALLLQPYCCSWLLCSPWEPGPSRHVLTDMPTRQVPGVLFSSPSQTSYSHFDKKTQRSVLKTKLMYRQEFNGKGFFFFFTYE